MGRRHKAMFFCATGLAAALSAGCGGGGGTGSFIDQNGFQIGTPRGPAPTAEAERRAVEIVRAVVPRPGEPVPTQARYTFEGGYEAELRWRPGLNGSSGRITGPEKGLPAVFEIGLTGTTIQFTDFSLEFVPRE